MGLDVYVWKKWKEADALSTKVSGEEGEVQAFRHNGEEIEIPSKKYPKHLFKVGYFRSSYNGSGFNSVMDQVTGMSMYDVFKSEDAYEFIPDWKLALKQLKKMQKKALIDEWYVCDTVTARSVGAVVHSEDEALEMFRKTLAEHSTDSEFNDFSNGTGEFHLKEPMKVNAMIGGVRTMFGSEEPVVYVVTRMAESQKQWYLQAIEIMIETCELVLKDKENTYFLIWSA